MQRKFQVGQEVEALWEDDGEYYTAVVKAILTCEDDTKISVLFTEYDEECVLTCEQIRTLNPKQFPTIEIEEPELQVGQKVKAQWEDGEYYEAIVKSTGRRISVNFTEYDDLQCEVTLDQIEIPKDSMDLNKEKITLDNYRQKKMEMIRLLNEGQTFEKYFHPNKKNSRFVWCTADLEFIRWGKNKKAKDEDRLEGKYVRTLDIQKVVKGAETDTFKKLAGKLSSSQKEKFLSLTLSIICNEIVLDLKADDETVRDEWYELFKFLMEYTGPGSNLRTFWLKRDEQLQADADKAPSSSLNLKKSFTSKSRKWSINLKRKSGTDSNRSPDIQEDSYDVETEGFQEGEEVEALWDEDGEWYNARVLCATDTGYLVSFTEYEQEAEVSAESIRKATYYEEPEEEFNPDLMDTMQGELDYEKQAQAMGMLEMLKILGDGDFFTHHESKGKSQRVYVCVTADMQYIKWDSKKDRARKPGASSKHCYEAKEIKVERGAVHQSFKKCLEGNSKAKDISTRCFSLVCDDRPPLNLATKDETSADKWIGAFEWLEEYHSSQGAMS